MERLEYLLATSCIPPGKEVYTPQQENKARVSPDIRKLPLLLICIALILAKALANSLFTFAYGKNSSPNPP